MLYLVTLTFLKLSNNDILNHAYFFESMKMHERAKKASEQIAPSGII